MSKLNIGNDLYLKGRIGWQGLSKNEYLENSEYKIINATALMDGYVDWNNCGFITKKRYDEAKEIQLMEGDILISKDGTLGKIGYVKNLTNPCSVSSGIFVLRNTKPEIVDFDYLYHIMKSNIFKDFINRNKALGSTIVHLYQRDLEQFDIELPCISEQRKIAKILNSIDNQITRNNDMVQKLQVLAHTTFDYFSKNKTRSDFVVLNDIIIEKDKSKIQVSDVQNASGYIPFFTSGDTILYTNKKLQTGFNIFLSTGGNAKVQAYYGDVAYSTDTWCITAKNNLQFYLFGYLKLIESQMDKLYFHGTGLKHLQKPIFLKSIITIPNEDLLMKYNTIVEPIYHQISKIEQITIKLECLKTKLLPLLINQQLV